MFSTTKSSNSQKAGQLPEDDTVATETPKARPTSSATMLNLATTRKVASEQYAQAAKAEKAYRIKKKATMAQANYDETKEHFREAFSHFKLAFKGLFSVIANITYLISEKREVRKQAAEKKAHEKNLERKKKLEEQLAKAEAQAGESKEEDKEKGSNE
ncbi:hypothetical protein FVEN_g9724 [Fusarium venenatum]|uniref:Uncharacterized protein n=1 Tax=Fusarium venenatum TaxID=56646 RepID=A0A2L2U004_9HYPO|nr:uncharacterized protein FVRRES_10973 [Fusarium venenatum]KAG8352229.1 hypothetical protein FVEN_g9724 [Fusarium venenatum]KAH6967539.1 hypothetical protein EDB82DRAFT_481818 [Fusarium venenatum]CEI70896.1 unnamed protein product [Fusarium venenatum]